MSRRLLREEADVQGIKEIRMMEDPQRLKMILNRFTWKILVMLSEREMYPLEIARKLGVHEQTVYYHIRKLVTAGAISVAKEEKRKGAVARYYGPVSPAFGIELSKDYKTVRKNRSSEVGDQLLKFFSEFINEDGVFEGKIVVGCPTPHGPFKTSARDGHYAAHLTFLLGQFTRIPNDFVIKLDVDVKAEKEENSNLILVGGPGTNLLTQGVNESLPVKFNMQPSKRGFLFGGLVSATSSDVYMADTVGLISKIVNPLDDSKRIIVLAGNKAVGTKACVLALAGFWRKTLCDYQGEEPFAAVIQGFDLDGDGKVDSIELLR